MVVDITCKTDHFNLSVIGDDFINDCCFGEDFSEWLVSALLTQGVEADVICMEDFGWVNIANHDGASYLICVAGIAEGDSIRPNFGEWRVMLERRRTIFQKILGKNEVSISDPLVAKVENILVSAGFSNVAIQP